MLLKTFTVISFGNYETKILVCNYVDGELLPIYKTTFLTNNCIENSYPVDKELLIDYLINQLKKVPLDVRTTELIVNIPIRRIDIHSYRSDEITVGREINKHLWKTIIADNRRKVSDHFKKVLDRKIYQWKIDGYVTGQLPLNEYIDRFTYKEKVYLMDTDLYLGYSEVFRELKDLVPKPKIVCDSIVIQKMFENPEKRYKLLLNIGHAEMSLEYYVNSVLYEQRAVNFGIRNLTNELCKLASINEETAIDLLKIYKDVSKIDTTLPVVNHFKGKFLEYEQTTIQDFNKLISVWLNKLIRHINDHLNLLSGKNKDVNEIYIYSPTNIFANWLGFIRGKLDKNVDIICLESNVIGLKESKYISLIASILYRVDELKDIISLPINEKRKLK